jgi:hypothetical protein
LFLLSVGSQLDLQFNPILADLIVPGDLEVEVVEAIEIGDVKIVERTLVQYSQWYPQSTILLLV